MQERSKADEEEEEVKRPTCTAGRAVKRVETNPHMLLLLLVICTCWVGDICLVMMVQPN